LAEPFLSPPAQPAGLDKVKARLKDSKTQTMPKPEGSCYADLTQPQGVTPIYSMANDKKKNFPKSGKFWSLIVTRCVLMLQLFNDFL